MRKAGDQLRISARLTRTSDGTQLWSEHYDRKLGDVFEIQEHIARAIVDHVRTKLLDPHTGPVVSRTTDDQDVYRLYLGGEVQPEPPDGTGDATGDPVS